jgi:hypothetical protein
VTVGQGSGSPAHRPGGASRTRCRLHVDGARRPAPARSTSGSAAPAMARSRRASAFTEPAEPDRLLRRVPQPERQRPRLAGECRWPIRRRADDLKHPSTSCTRARRRARAVRDLRLRERAHEFSDVLYPGDRRDACHVTSPDATYLPSLPPGTRRRARRYPGGVETPVLRRSRTPASPATMPTTRAPTPS